MSKVSISHVRQLLLGLSISLVFLTSPSLAFAQTTKTTTQEAAQIELLLELIARLEERLAELRAATGQTVARDDQSVDLPLADAVFFDENSLLNELNGEVTARYEIKRERIDSPSTTHERYVERLFALMPEEYHRYLVEFVVFTSPRTDIDAFVETVLPYEGQWRYGVSEIVFADPISAAVQSELIVHEFAHVFSLHEAFSSDRPASCHEYFAGRGGCVGRDTLYGRFLDEFWDDARLDATLAVQEARNYTRALNKFYRENDDEFVTRYAATNPAEDFAESFTSFVLYEDDQYGDVATEKVAFFNRFSHPRALKAEILSDL